MSTDLPDRDEAWLAGAAVDKIVTAYEEGVLRSRDEMDEEAITRQAIDEVTAREGLMPTEETLRAIWMVVPYVLDAAFRGER